MQSIEIMNKLLRSYIRDEISKSDFSESICKINGLEESLGRTQFLHLKHGDKLAALEVFQTKNQCETCSKLHTDDLSHSKDTRQKLDNLLQRSKIERVRKPDWYTPHLAKNNPYGAQGFYICSSCGSIIEVCEPERMYRGCCEVIG